ncbi:MAG: hypothetical protein SVM86_03945 [Candidatus Cloacimonadota bacterium]|nr:hypothetical protein [Candidatus Cloacimonadota bacterium]
MYSKNLCLILEKKRNGENTTGFENQIDLMVYKLYELTYEEAKIVDLELNKVLAQFGLSKADYERMSVEKLGNMGNGRSEISIIMNDIKREEEMIYYFFNLEVL